MEVVHTTAFANGPGGGNPCPVVLDAEALETSDMQAVARRHGHECGFVVSPRGAERVRLRFFVPEHEMSMCVHATIACVRVLLETGRLAGDAHTVETAIGALAVEVADDGQISIEQRIPERSPRHPDPAAVASVLRLAPAAIAGPPESWSASRPKLIVPVADRSTLDALEPDFDALWALCDACDTTGVYAWADDGDDLVARQFPVRAGYPEDAATGVAAAALGGYLAAHRPPGAGATVCHVIRQGEAMGAPSLLTVLAESDGTALTSIRVRGRAELLPPRPGPDPNGRPSR